MKLTKNFTAAISFALLGLTGSATNAQSFQAASQEIDVKLEAALQQLSEVREEIAEAKIPLSTEVTVLEDEVLALRSEQERLLKIRDSRTIDLSSLRRSVESLEDQREFINSRLDEFVREFEARLSIAERSQFEGIAREAKLAPGNVNLSEEEKRGAQVVVIQAAIDRMNDLIGGQSFEGRALSPEGVVTEGVFVSVGPTTYFSGADGTVAGVVENQVNVEDPVVVYIGSITDGISKVAEGQVGELPLDATLGKAIKKVKAQKSLMEYVEDGGAVGYVIIGLGALALLLTVFKCVEIFSFKSPHPPQIDAILDDLDKGNTNAAQEKASAVGGAAGEMLTAGVVSSEEKRGILEEMMFERILKARPYLERFLPFLAITAAAAPLLGLLGTVIGMIKTFQLITIFGTGDAKSLSTGISEALVTTALGLIVAIPTLILHGMLSRMAKRKLGLLEQGAVAFVNGLMARRHESKEKS